MSYIKLANFGNFNEFFILRILCRKDYTAQLIKKIILEIRLFIIDIFF
jgi:hypothetical protein